MSIGQRLLRIALVVVVLALGGGVFAALIATRPTAERTPAPPLTVPVTTVTAHADEHAIVVRAQGSVIPAQELVLQAELNGRVIWRNDEVVPGGLVRHGDVLVRIDPRDFRAAVAQQTAQLESQRVQLQTEERRRAVAEREWAILARDSSASGASEEGRALAMREPQLRSAEAATDATEAQLRQARLTLTRTTLRAPFDALVREADVEVGQLVGPTARLATLVGSDHFWVQVSLPVEALRAIRLPSAGRSGSEARVVQTVGADPVERTGRVVRVLGDLDPVGRMARVLVEIDDPLGLQADPASGARPMPMLLGAFVRVEIDAGTLPGTIEIPRTALRDADTVWVVEDGHLAIREVGVSWRRQDTVLVGDGLAEGAQVITTPLASPVAGMAVRILETAPTEAEAAR